MPTHLIDLVIDPSVEPRLCPDRWHKGRCIEVGCLGGGRIIVDVANLLSICLLHHPKAAKLALDAVEVAVVIIVAGDKAVAADAVVGLHSLNTMDREW